MKKIVSIIATLAMVMSLFTGIVFAGNGNGKGNELGFKDTKGHWAEKAINELKDSEILKGFDDGTFRPNQELNQGQLAVILERIKELKANDENTDDENDIAKIENSSELDGVPGWAKHAVAKGIEGNYLDAKRFHSAQQVNRLQACVDLAEALGLSPVYDVKDDTAAVMVFKDKTLMTEYQYGMLMALYDKHYIQGYPDGNFNPYKLLNRAQIASIIAKIIEEDNVIDQNDETAPDWSKNSYITASAIASTHVKLAWNGADSSAVQYKITYKLAGEDKEALTTAKEITIKGLAPGKDYNFTVNARDVNKNWSEGPDVDVTTLKADESTSETTAPVWSDTAKITITNLTTGSIYLNWPNAKGDDVEITKYIVKFFQSGDLKDKEEPASSNLTETELVNNTEYKVEITAVDEKGNESEVLSKTFTTDWE